MVFPSKWSWLCKLYYETGKQTTDFQLQIAMKDANGEQMWSRRKSFLTVHTLEDTKWIQRANNRTTLNNEVILDYDRVILPEDVMKDLHVLSAITYCKKKHYRYAVYHTGSKGVHVHIYIDDLFRMSPYDRKRYREQLIARFRGDIGLKPNFSGDYQKASDNVPIALEFVPHWKIGRPKTLIDSNFL